MKSKKQTEVRLGWAPEREAKVEPRASSLNNERAIEEMSAKASTKSGPKYAPMKKS
jgi:hypothetical protein